MGTSVGVGVSLHRNPREAGKEAVRIALEQGKITVPDFVFVFATVGYDQQLLIRSIREAASGAPLSGCSGEGIITQGVSAETNFGVCVMVIASDELRFSNFRVKNLPFGFEAAGRRLAEDLRPNIASDTFACFLFVDGLVFDFDPFRDGLEKGLALDRTLPLFGGLAADNWATRRTYQYHDDDAFSEGVSCVLLSGSGGVAWGVNHGCVPVGTRSIITRCKGNVIYEIDGIPALEALKDYVEDNAGGQWNKVTLNLCLGFRTPEPFRPDYGDFTIRYIMDKNDEEGCVTIQSDTEEGTELWIMRRDKELIADGLQAIARQIRETLGAREAKFVLHFECMGRGKVVFREQERAELLRSLQEQVGADLPWIGFYSYGEIGPVSRYNCIHNFTAVVAAIF